MDKYQKAAKLLNSKAPVDGQFGKERIAYLNPLEEEILKSIGGSGEVIIPSAEEQADPDVPSYGAWKWFKKKFFDDILGIDDNKFLGMGKHTFLGGIGNKVWDDWLGNDSTKSWGVSDATWDDLLPTLVGFAVGGPLGAKLGMSASAAGGLASLGMSALDKVIENNSGDTSGRQKQREDFAELKNAFEADRQEALARGDRTFFFQGKEYYTDNNDDGSARSGSAGGGSNVAGSTAAGNVAAKGYDEEGLANLRSVAGALQGRGKAGIIDPSDTGRLSALLASPGDENYVEGFSIGGQDMDPFPSWLRGAGDRINSTIDDAGYYAGEYLGDSDQRMYDFMPILDRMKGMNIDAISTLGSIFDRGEGGLESQYRGFQDDFNTLAEGQKLLNQITAESNQGLVDDVLGAGDQYSASLADAKNLQTELTNKSFDALSSLEDIKRMQNMEQTGRFADTRNARQNAAFDLSDAEYGAATGLSGAEYGASDKLFGSRSKEAEGILGAQVNDAEGIFGSELGAARGLLGAQTNEANNIFGSELGAAQGLLGAQTDEANNIFGSELGAAQGIYDSTASDALGGLRARQDNASGILGAQDREALGIFGAQQGAADRIKNAERAKALAAGANAENLANTNQRGLRSATVGQGNGTMRNMGNAMIRAQLGQQRSDLLADALIRDADRRGTADIELAQRLGGSGVGFSERMGDAGIGFADKMGGAGIDLASSLGSAGIDRAGRLGQAGVNFANLLGGADISRAGRLGQADVNFADRMGSADISRSERLGDAGVDFADRMGSALVDRAMQQGESDIGLAGRLGQSNINLADRVGGAETQFRNQLEDILFSDADKLGAEIEADRFATLAEMNPGEGNILANEANLQNKLRALGYGDQILNAMGANIGIDQATLDDERRLLSDLTNMRLGNTSLIPALGMQNAQLPATLLEAALAPIGPLIRNASPYTTTGQLPAPVTTFSPIAPPQQKNEWYDYAMMAPQVLSGIKGITDIWGDNG
jgi:hypothetical protein